MTENIRFFLIFFLKMFFAIIFSIKIEEIF